MTHTQRREDPFLDKLIERLPRGTLHHIAQHRGRVAVVELLAGLMQQRSLCQPVHELFQRGRRGRIGWQRSDWSIALDTVLAVITMNRRISHEMVSQPGRVS